jgi:hypothetical protein
MSDTSPARRLAARVWAYRAGAELEAARRFARLADRLDAAGAVAPVVAMARAAATDELRHHRLCVALAARLGGRAKDPDDRAPPEVAPAALSARERALYEVVAMSCLTETLSAALLGAIVERAVDPVVRSTAHEVLRDEVDHSRLGWAHLAAEHRRGPSRFLDDHLPAMLAGTVDEALFRASDGDGDGDELAGLGALPRPDRLAIFEATMRDVVFPGLQRFGVDTTAGARWVEARRAT